MSVRAKFVVQRIERSNYGGYQSAPQEMQTIVLAPVYSQDPESENKKFWDATPQGEVRLGTINSKAGDYFELGKEYYLDFTLAEQAAEASA